MAKVVAGMTISADGFIAERNGDVWPLYKDLAGPRGAEYLNEMIECRRPSVSPGWRSRKSGLTAIKLRAHGHENSGLTATRSPD